MRIFITLGYDFHIFLYMDLPRAKLMCQDTTQLSAHQWQQSEPQKLVLTEARLEFSTLSAYLEMKDEKLLLPADSFILA